jgi:hypothetical protein
MKTGPHSSISLHSISQIAISGAVSRGWEAYKREVFCAFRLVTQGECAAFSGICKRELYVFSYPSAYGSLNVCEFTGDLQNKT